MIYICKSCRYTLYLFSISVGIISAVLGGIDTYSICLILKFAIKHSNHSNDTHGIFGLIKEIVNSGKRSRRAQAAILYTTLFFTLAGESLSFIVTTGIKANTSIQLGVLETVETRLGFSTLELLKRGELGDSQSILQVVSDFRTNSVRMQ